MEEVLQSSKHKVALTELYPVFEDSGDLDNTAMALEHLRYLCVISLKLIQNTFPEWHVDCGLWIS